MRVKKSSKKMAAADEELKNMVMTFRVSELQMLLGYAGRNKSGRKTELQHRAVELLKLRSTPIQLKIRELYKTIQQSLTNGQPPGEPPAGTSGGGGVVGGGGGGGGGGSSNVNNGSGLVTNPIMAQQPHQRTARIGMPANPPSYPVYAQQRESHPMFQPSMYQNYSQKVVNPTPPLTAGYPVHPDVRLKKLPFYDLIGELIKPSTLVPSVNSSRLHEQHFVFHLTPSQANEIALSKNTGTVHKNEYVVQVQMRFCLLETSCEQDDFFPPGLIVKVNGKITPLPNPIPTNKQGVEPKRPPKPVNITALVRISPTVTNNIQVTWAPEYGRSYVLCACVVRKLNSTQLLQRMRAKGIRHADFTTGLIKEKLSEDNDIEVASTTLRVSLICPLGKMRMQTPCRSSVCSHLQCFDAAVFLQMNERKPTWLCPVCDKPCLYDTLSIDGYFQDVLNSSRLNADTKEVTLHQDGSWTTAAPPLDTNRNRSGLLSSSSLPLGETISVEIDDDGSDIEIPPNKAVVKAGNSETPKMEVVVDLTLSDSESDDDTLMITEKAPPPPSATPSATSAVVKSPNADNTASHAFNRMFSTDSNSSVSMSGGGGGRSSVTSSGYISPNIINLDSPSPPPSTSPAPTAAHTEQLDPPPATSQQQQRSMPSLTSQQQQQQQQQPQLMNSSTYSSIIGSSMPTFFDLEQDSNSPLFQTPHY